MTDINDIKDGFDFFALHSASAKISQSYTSEWLNPIIKEIRETIDNLSSFEGSEKTIETLSGDIMEFFHAGTANIDAASKGLTADFSVPRSNVLGSPDIVRKSTGELWQVKYYKNGVESAKAQTITYKEAVNNPSTSVGAREALKKGIVNKNDSIYAKMGRIVPKGQLEEGKEFVARRMAKNEGARSDILERDKLFLEHGTEQISTSDGVKSTPISRNDAKIMAEDIRNGNFDPKEWGLSLEQWIHLKDVVQNAMRAGITSAVISAVISAAPDIIKAVEHLIQNGELDIDEIKNTGTKALSSSSKGFLIGAISASALCFSGHIGATSASVVAAMAVISVDTLCNCIQVACGNKTMADFADELSKNVLISTCALIGGSVGNMFIPSFGYLIGSFMGSMLGSYIYDSGKKVFLSLCVESGYTFFGLVEQNYALPTSIIKEIGLDVFEYDEFEYEKFVPSAFELEKAENQNMLPQIIDTSFLRRGVIGVSKIGYVE